MAKFAVLDNKVVINIIVADDKSIAENATGFLCIQFDDTNIAAIGYLYDENTNTFINNFAEDEIA